MFWLGVVSFLTDFSAEMIYFLIPAFLETLGAGALALAAVEGVAESTAAALKLVSGLWTDRVRRRKPLVAWGYGLSSFARPLIGLVGSWWGVLAVRFTDRVGKGLRTSARDALITDTTPEGRRGTAFGFHRAMDHAGNVVGPLLAAGLLAWWHFHLRSIFLLAAVPAALVMAALLLGVREKAPVRRPRVRREGAWKSLKASWKGMDSNFRRLLGALFLFTLGNSTDLFLLKRLGDAGLGLALVGLGWSALHVVKMGAAYYFGRLSDRVSKKALVLAGWVVYALVYLGFGLASSPAALTAIFLAYGVYYGLTEAVQSAWVADLAPAGLRGSAFGYFNGVIGLAGLPASLIFGALWERFGMSTAFFTGAALAGLACLVLARVREA